MQADWYYFFGAKSPTVKSNQGIIRGESSWYRTSFLPSALHSVLDETPVIVIFFFQWGRSTVAQKGQV